MDTYQVQQGDTLGAIATKYGVPLSSISGYASGDPNKIGVGETLSINKSPSLVSATDLSKTQTPITTPPPVPTSAASGLGATADSMVKSVKDSISADMAKITPDVEAEKTNITSLLQKIGLAQKDKITAYDTPDSSGTSVNNVKKEVDSITSQMEALDLNTRRRIEDITNKNGTGMFGPGAQGEVDRITREANSAKADMALTLLAKTRQYDSLKSVIDAKVDAETEAAKTELQTLQLFYNDNKEKLSKDEDRLYNLQIQDAQRVYDDQKDLRTKIANIQADIAGNGAPLSVVQNVGKATTIDEAYKAAGSYFGALDRQYKAMQIEKLKSDIVANGVGGGTGGDASQILAYAQQYASTGQIPTGLPKGTFGIVAQAAKELPKPEGTLVDINTGVKPSKLSSTQADGIVALKDLSQKLSDAEVMFKDLNTGIIAGTFKKFFPSDKQQQYDALRSEIVDLLARARTGAAINASEEALYMGKIPGKFNNSLFLGGNGENKLSGLKSSIDGKLTTNLKTNGLAIYGYSEVDLGGTKYKVGDVVKGQNGQLGRVNPDGTISLISQ